MSIGGSNPSSPIGATNDKPTTATINSPIAKGPNAPEAPGGKGGFPAAQNPYGQQQSQVYMPPSQPTFYDQAFSRQYYQPQYAQPQYAQPQYALGGLRAGPSNNAYVRPYSPPSPFNVQQTNPMEAPPPPGERQYAGNYSPQYSYLSTTQGGFIPPPSEEIRRSAPELLPMSQQRTATNNQSQQNQYGLGGLMSGMPGQKSDPLMQFDPRINLSPNAFGPPPEPVQHGWIDTPGGRLWNA